MVEWCSAVPLSNSLVFLAKKRGSWMLLDSRTLIPSWTGQVSHVKIGIPSGHQMWQWNIPSFSRWFFPARSLQDLFPSWNPFPHVVAERKHQITCWRSGWSNLNDRHHLMLTKKIVTFEKSCPIAPHLITPAAFTPGARFFCFSQLGSPL